MSRAAPGTAGALARGMIRFSRLLLLATLFVASCAGIHLVPKEQAARDLQCPLEQVHVQADGRAVGCGKVLHYYAACSDDGKDCKFIPNGGTMAHGAMPR